MKKLFLLVMVCALVLPLTALAAETDPPGGTTGSVAVIKNNPPADASADYRRGWTQGFSQGQGRGRVEGRKAGIDEGIRAGNRKGRQDGDAAGERDGRMAGERVGRENGIRDGQTTGEREGISEGRFEAKRRSREEGYNTGKSQGYNDGYADGLNAGEYQVGYSAGAEKARQVEEQKGLSEGHKDGFRTREQEIRQEVLNSTATRSIQTDEGESLGAEIVTNDLDSKLILARNGNERDNAEFEKGKRDGYQAGYRKAYDQFRKVGYDLGYQQSYQNARDQAYQRAYERAFEQGEDQSYSIAYRQAYDTTYRRFFDRYAAIRDEVAYQEGKADGYSVGRADGYQKATREQYDKGYENGYRETAAQIYPEAYQRGVAQGRASAEAYFDTNAVVEFKRVIMSDEDGDGVYVAGERVKLFVELVNFGRRPGNTELKLKGDALLSVEPMISFGPVPGKKLMNGVYSAITIKPAAGHNVTLAFRTDLVVDGKNVQQKVFEVMVTNPYTTRYRTITSALYWIDSAISELGPNATGLLKTARTSTHAILTLPNFDINSDYAPRAKKAAERIKEASKKIGGRPADMLKVAVSRLTEPELKVKIEKMNQNPSADVETVQISVTHKKGWFSKSEDFKEKFLLADLPLAYDGYRFVSYKVDSIKGKGSIKDENLDEIAFRFTFHLSKKWLAKEKATGYITLTLEKR